MNVLIFVTTILMLLSIMTYARLDSYRNSQAFQIVFKHYMQDQERGYINGQADVVYDDIKVRETPEEGKKNNSPRIDASPRIAIGMLFDSKRDAQAEDWEQTKTLLNKLITTLYKDQPFYQKIIAGRPNVVDELISGITQAIDQLSNEKIPKKTGDLANLKLDDPVLDSFLYKILHGAFYMGGAYDEHNLMQGTDNVSEDDIVTTDEGSGQSQEYKSPDGYHSLLDYVTGRKKSKIRVYLAPRNVLMAVFKDENTVDSIIQERERLYQQAVNTDQMDHLNESFKSQFSRMVGPGINEDTLNFSVSKTNPKYYR